MKPATSTSRTAAVEIDGGQQAESYRQERGAGYGMQEGGDDVGQQQGGYGGDRGDGEQGYRQQQEGYGRAGGDDYA